MTSKHIFWISFLLPGSGSLLLKRYKKGFIELLITAIGWFSTIFYLLPTIFRAFFRNPSEEYDGNLTLGQVPYEDNSFLILIGAVFASLVILSFIFIAYVIARSAMKLKIEIDEGKEILSFREKAKLLAPDVIPYAIQSPAIILMLLFLIVPAIVSIAIAFTNYKQPILPPAFLIEWKGFENFASLVTDARLSSVFSETILWTLIWTVCASTLTIVIGLLLAVISNSKKIKGKKFFRTVYLLPWAVPAFLTILIFQIFFSKVGTFNTVVLPLLTATPYSVSGAIGFLIDPNLAKVTIILIQAWLGFPYIYILTTGILQTIPDDLYEAASMDGGNAFTNFMDITLPIIFQSAAPTFITQYTFNFNNVTIIYLLADSVVKNVGSLYSPLETVASLGYQLTLDAEYSTAAVFTLVTSVIVSIVVLTLWIKTGAFKKEDVI